MEPSPPQAEPPIAVAAFAERAQPVRVPRVGRGSMGDRAAAHGEAPKPWGHSSDGDEDVTSRPVAAAQATPAAAGAGGAAPPLVDMPGLAPAPPLAAAPAATLDGAGGAAPAAAADPAPLLEAALADGLQPPSAAAVAAATPAPAPSPAPAPAAADDKATNGGGGAAAASPAPAAKAGAAPGDGSGAPSPRRRCACTGLVPFGRKPGVTRPCCVPAEHHAPGAPCTRNCMAKGPTTCFKCRGAGVREPTKVCGEWGVRSRTYSREGAPSSAD